MFHPFLHIVLLVCFHFAEPKHPLVLECHNMLILLEKKTQVRMVYLKITQWAQVHLNNIDLILPANVV